MEKIEFEKLCDTHKKARESYYNLDPIMSDQEYDAITDLIKSIDPSNDEVIKVGAETPSHSVWEKTTHVIPMGSLNKVNSKSEFEKWAKQTGASVFLTTLKIDGSSMEVIYNDGKLTKCISRGDGIVGDNVTKNIIKIPNLPKKIDKTGQTVIRGEVVMLKSVFNDKYSDKYANPRNTAAGKIRDKKNDGDDCVNLNFVAYTMLESGDEEEKQFRELANLGFEIPMFRVSDSDGVMSYFEEVKSIRDSIPYEIDGLVSRVNNIKEQEDLGVDNLRPNGQIAIKFDPSMSITKVMDIKWQVGLSGRVTPVASVEAVNIGGVTITSISLHNLAMFRELKLKPACRVLVSRRNDVIPYIEENLDV